MSVHKPVLLKESIEALNLKEGGIVVDATLGGGGHSLEILERIGKSGTLVAIDRDEHSIERFKKSYGNVFGGQIVLVKDNFANLSDILEHARISQVDGILADLGFSSDQLEEETGISFLKDAPLDMRLDREDSLTAEEVVNEYSQEELAGMLRKYGEEKYARRIAEEIEKRRKAGRIKSTLELAEIISEAVPPKYKHGRIHPATRTFQALRIEVNKELDNLQKFLPQAVELLGRGGRLAVISFHSLEDRIVKSALRENARGCICPNDFPQCQCGRAASIRIITRKPVRASQNEVNENPRSRSARLRIGEKI